MKAGFVVDYRDTARSFEGGVRLERFVGEVQVARFSHVSFMLGEVGRNVNGRVGFIHSYSHRKPEK